MVGMARKNENSAPAFLSTLHTMAPIRVEPDRDMPGTSARHWNRPMISDVLMSSFWAS